MSSLLRTQPTTRRRWGLRLAACVVAVGTIATVVAFRNVFDRPAETAFRLIPQDALVFGSIDLSPSPEQALVFKKIDDALARNGLKEMVDESVLNIIMPEGQAEELAPYVKRGLTVAMLPKDADRKPTDDNFVVMVSISDGPKVSDYLKRKGRRLFHRGTSYYKLGPESPGAMVIDDQMVMAMNPHVLHRIEQVQLGQVESIISDPGYLAARAKLDADANVMVFVTPSFAKEISTEVPKEAAEAVTATKWGAVGAAIRDGGIQVSFHGDHERIGSMDKLTSISPVRSDLYSMLPSGAYGVVALSQPANYFEFGEQLMVDEEDADGMHEFEAEMRENLGLDLRTEVLPALRGNAIVAAYPAQSKDGKGGLEFVAVIDDSQNSKPGALAAKFAEKLNAQLKEQGEPEVFERVEKDGVVRWKISTQQEAELRKSLAMEEAPLRGDLLTSEKTVIWATVGDTLVISSNDKLLERAVGTIQSKQDSLSTDRAFGEDSRKLGSSQTLAVFSLARIAEGVLGTIDTSKMDADESKTMNTVVDAFKSLTEPFAVRYRMTETSFSGGVFIPLDYDHMLDFIGGEMKEDR